MIHKLNIASGAVSEAMENRDFAEATNAAHQFFLWDLCDVFIVSYPLLADGNQSLVKWSEADKCRRRPNPSSKPTSTPPPKYLRKIRCIHVLKVV